METTNLTSVTKNIYDSKLCFFSLKTLKDIIGVQKESTFYSFVSRLVSNKVLIKIEKNKYILASSQIHDFGLANFIYEPSYISLETALNFYGILSQFPYEITSCTSRKTNQKEIKGKVFSFVHINKALFWGYEKRDNFLIAFPEKAFLDQIYFVAKGLKKINFDELDYSFINRKRFKIFLKKYPQIRQFKKAIENLKKYFKT